MGPVGAIFLLSGIAALHGVGRGLLALGVVVLLSYLGVRWVPTDVVLIAFLLWGRGERPQIEPDEELRDRRRARIERQGEEIRRMRAGEDDVEG